ncbi:hypothetical protein H4R24_001680 [Coemansia sp. RSA 988]|nr:hypothetical protein H4R24_001680 [Coemansia sp. RSA 988]
MPKLLATGWNQSKIENMLIVLLDHGNNQDVRVFGFYTLNLYMVSINGNFSETIIDLFTNAISLRSFSYVDAPEASRLAGNIMCAIARGIDITDIGCGQRAIRGFKTGRASICPVLQDVVYPINPQGILALRMLRNMLVLMTYLASLIPDPQATYIAFLNLELICTQDSKFQFTWCNFESIYDIPHSAPMPAMSNVQIQLSLNSIYQLFKKAYLSWIYPKDSGAYEDRHVRRVPVLGLRIFINFMLESLVPRHAYMVCENEFFMPNLNKSSTSDEHENIRCKSDSDRKFATGIKSIATRSYDVLCHVMLDHDMESALFFTDILRLALQIMPSLAIDGYGTDHLDKEELMQASYDCCLGALIVIRLWMTSKEEYRPVHLLPGEGNTDMLTESIADYLNYVYRLITWIVEENKWSKKKIILLYNSLLIHRAAVRLYRHQLPQDTKRSFMNSLQTITLLFLSKPSADHQDKDNPESYANRALTILTECLLSGWLVLGDRLSDIALQFKEIYDMPTIWTSHIHVWSNVLRALTIARGRHILKVEERTLIQESMFAGQRQRRGMNKVDEYMARLEDPCCHLNACELRDIFETSTPFNITSNTTWSTLRLVFASVKAAAQEELAFIEACEHQEESTENKLANPQSDYRSKSLLRSTNSIYAQIFLSGRKNLSQIAEDILTESIVKSKKGPNIPKRTFRKHSAGYSKQTLDDYAATMGAARLQNKKGKTSDTSAAKLASSSSHPLETSHVWKRIVSPFCQKKDADPGTPASSLSQSGANTRHMVQDATTNTLGISVKQDAQGNSNGAEDNIYLKTQRVQELNHMPNIGWRGVSGTDAQSDSVISVQLDMDGHSHSQIGPAQLATDLIHSRSAPRHLSQQLKGSKIANIDSQMTDVAVFNRYAAVNLLGNIKARAWHSEAVWVDFHISDFVYVQDDKVGDLQYMWLAWASLLGPPVNANAVRSKVILRGLLRAWDVYRAVLDCSRYTPDNDDVMLNTMWWVAEIAAKFGTNDFRGRVAQTAIFRMGCRCSDNINSRVIFLRSCFLQAALVVLSPLAKGQPVTVDQIQMFLIECRLLLSLGISGSRILLLSLAKGLNRIFLAPDSCSGGLPEAAIQGATTLLISLVTLLEAPRTLATRNSGSDTGSLTDSSIARTRMITMYIMKAIVDQFNRVVDNATSDAVFAIQGLLQLLTAYLIKAPELIVSEDSHVLGNGGHQIRDFLVEKIFKRCANPLQLSNDATQVYNYVLVSADSEHGIVLNLEPVPYKRQEFTSLTDFVSMTADERQYPGNATESIKLMGEVLYTTLMMHFDEDSRIDSHGVVSR